MLRRTVLKALSGLLAFAVAKPQIVNAEVLPDADLVPIPDWCPKGFLPMLRQKITPKQFPCLFEPTKLADGKYFYPPYWGKSFGIVEEFKFGPTDWYESSGDGVNHNDFIKREGVSVAVIAIEPFRWPSGALAPPGFQSRILVEKDKFEAYYNAVRG